MAALHRILLCLAVSFPFFVQAEEPASSILVLANGDRITGREVERKDGVIHFQSDLVGLIKAPEEKARIEPRPTVTDLELQLAATSAPSAGFPETLKKTPPVEVAASPAAPPKRANDSAAPPEPRQVTVKRQLEFGFTNQSGRRDRTDVSFRANLERKTARSELRFQGKYFFGESNDQRVTDAFGGNLRFRRDLSAATFAQAEARYDRDAIKNVDHDFSQSVGMGRSLIERQGLKITLGGGGAARFRDIETSEAEWTYNIDAFQDLVYSINSHFKVTQDMSLLFSPFDEDEYLVKLNTALTGRLTNTLNMSMRYEFEYDRSLIPDSRQNQRIVTSVGYAF